VPYWKWLVDALVLVLGGGILAFGFPCGGGGGCWMLGSTACGGPR